VVKCPKCGNEKWSQVSCITITENYLKAMKEDLPSKKYAVENKEWAKIARVGNYIMEFQCNKCSFIVPELCY
jgi:predicted nucleic-acid-binding Zn-ribbon protein